MGETGARRLRPVEVSVAVCFFLSGAAGLVYEVVWMRMLGLVFGHTVVAITTVLVAFMAGLALGASLFGRVIDRRGRPLLLYGVLEVGIGLSCLLVPALLAGAAAAYVAAYRSLEMSAFAFGLLQFGLVFGILLIPTTMMGASLPVLAKFFVDRAAVVGRTVGTLYALNTFGAVVGSAAAGFVLLPAIGVWATTLLAAAANLAVGGWALAAHWWTRAGDAAAPAGRANETAGAVAGTASGPAPLAIALVLIGTALSGAASMTYEVAWTRALSLAIGSSTYAFSAMLTTFLVGLALGSFAFARLWGDRRASLVLFGWLQLAVAVTALALVPAFDRLPDLVLALLNRLSPSPTGALVTQFALSFAIMIVPTTLIGAAFPCAVQICARFLGRLGRDIGQVYSANTAGTIAGALVAGFLLVPWLGAQGAMRTAAVTNAAVAAAVLALSAGAVWRRAAALAALPVFAAAAVVLPDWDPRVMAGGASIYVRNFAAADDPAARFREEARSRPLLFYREGLNATVSVDDAGGVRSLRVDGKVDASNGGDMLTQAMIGHLPLFLHPRPGRVLVIGLGSGVTIGAVARHDAVREIDVVELEPAVVEASEWFVDENRNALRDPRVRLVIGDGRNFVLASERQYDAIISEPSNPWMAGVANLFSVDFYRQAQRRLADGGIMVQWVQGYALFPGELKMIVNTFRRVFPHSTLWRGAPGDYFLVGQASALALDLAMGAERMAVAPVREEMAAFGMASPLDLLTLFLLGEADLARFGEGAAVNTDDRPLLEFAAPLALYADTRDENARLLRAARSAEFPPVVHAAGATAESRRLHFARVLWARGETEDALAQLRAAPADPDDPEAQAERVRLLLALGQVDAASRGLDRLARRAPEHPAVQRFRNAGAILRQVGAEEKIAAHTRSQSGAPAEVHNAVGVFFTHLGIRFEEPAFFDLAVDAFQAALGIEPQSYAGLNNLGNAYFELGRLDDVARIYRRVIELAPDLAETRFNLGLVYQRQGDWDGAVREFEAAQALRPEWDEPRRRLAEIRARGASTAGGAQSAAAQGRIAEGGVA